MFQISKLNKFNVLQTPPTPYPPPYLWWLHPKEAYLVRAEGDWQRMDSEQGLAQVVAADLPAIVPSQRHLGEDRGDT
jgi:hypothetical protein